MPSERDTTLRQPEGLPLDIEDDDLVDDGDPAFFAAVAGVDLDQLAGWVHGCLAAGVDPATGSRINR